VTGIDITAQPTGPEYEDIVKALKTQIMEHSLPLWYSEGWDPAAGCFVEKLDIEGGRIVRRRGRVRVQARQICCFAKAAGLGWYPQGREIAMKGLEFSSRKQKAPRWPAGFRSLTRSGWIYNELYA
jgi:mannose/cellobiose epimerase-like protein (N-acyl-D-glucosamine 2-epimerase family)